MVKYLKIFIFLIWLILLPFMSAQVLAYYKNPEIDTTRRSVVIVFGAGIIWNNKPSKVLRLRLDEAKKLYDYGQVKKILVSGDNSKPEYNEPAVMKNYLIQVDIPAQDIIEDFGGRRTYDTCYRAKNTFGVDKAILVSQSFHLPRAKITCEGLGLNVILKPSANSSWNTTTYGIIREIPANFVAWFDLLTGRQPEVGSNGSEPQL